MRFFRSRTGKIVTIATVLIAVPAVAFAAWVFLSGFKGSIATAKAGLTLDTVSVGGQTDMTCAATKGTNNEINLTVSDAYPGAKCLVSANFSNPVGNAPLKLQGVSYNAGSTAVKVGFPADAYCGMEWLAGTVNKPAPFTLEIAADAAMGTTFSPDATAGLQFVPSGQFSAAKCPAVITFP